MNYNRSFNFLKNLPRKLNNFYKKNSKFSFRVDNKSKTIKDFDPVTNIDKGFEKYKVNKIYQQFDFDIIKKSELYIELKRDKLVSWKINRYTGEGTRKVADLSWDYKCEKVDKLF